MAISFEQVPSDQRVPIVAAEINSSQASQGPALLSYRGLIVGQRLAGGSAAANSLHRVTSADQVVGLAGRGSMLHRQAIAWFASNRGTELWIGVLDDDAAGVAATGTITAAGPATADGTIALYLGGVRVTVGVTDGDAATAIATAIAEAINAESDLPITAAVNGTVLEQVDVTFRHKGEAGNYYDMRDSFRAGEELPAGVSLTYGAMAGGTTNPALTDLIAALGDAWYHVWANPYTDSTSLDAIEAELASRFDATRMIDGVAYASASGSHSTLTTLGGGRNSPHSCIFSQDGSKPLTPPFEHAAEVAAVRAKYAAQDPARPAQTLPLRHTVPGAEADRWTQTERNLFLHDGIATTRAGPGGTVELERSITTYQTSAAGSPDTAYLDDTTPLTLLYLRYSFRVRWQNRYPRHKLANDGTRVGAGQDVVKPKAAKGEALGWFRAMESLGLVEGFDQFKEDLIVERNATDPNRLDFKLSPDLINQLMVSAAQIAFRL